MEVLVILIIGSLLTGVVRLLRESIKLPFYRVRWAKYPFMWPVGIVFWAVFDVVGVVDGRWRDKQAIGELVVDAVIFTAINLFAAFLYAVLF